MPDGLWSKDRIAYHPALARRIHAECFAKRNGLSFDEAWLYIALCEKLGQSGFWQEDPRDVWRGSLATSRVIDRAERDHGAT